MSIIHMDVSQCRYAQRQITEFREELSNLANQTLRKGKGVVDQMWIARGAEQYLNELNDWKTELLQLLNKLDKLSRELDSEIDEWIRVSRDD